MGISKTEWVSGAEADQYSAALTGNPLLFHESRIVAGLLESDLKPEDLRHQIIDQNLFGYRSTKSVPKRVSTLTRRLEPIPAEVRTFIATAPPGEARKVLLLVLAVRDRLFREFVQEYVVPKFVFHDEEVTDFDFRRFFEIKGEADPRVADRADTVKKKLKAVISAALAGAGLLSTRKPRRVIKPALDPETAELVRTFFPPEYCRILGVS